MVDLIVVTNGHLQSGQDQGTTTAGALVEVAYPFTPPARDDVIKARILAVLATDQPYPYGWGPARWTWNALRRRIGGRVRSGHFRRLVDDLMREGQVLEVYEAARGWGWRQHRHLLIRVDRIDGVQWGRMVRVRGRQDVVRRLASRTATLVQVGNDLDGDE
jgi:hypothetical protein